MKFNAYSFVMLSTFFFMSANAYCDSTIQNPTPVEQTEFERRVKLRKEIKADDSRTVESATNPQGNAQSKPFEPVSVQAPAAPVTSQSQPGTPLQIPSPSTPTKPLVQEPASDIPAAPTENRLEALRTARLKMEVINEDKVIESLELSRVQDETNRLARILGKNQITAQNNNPITSPQSNIDGALMPPSGIKQTVIK